MPLKTGGERSSLRFKCLQGSAAGMENAAPLAVPGAAIGGRSRLGLADRCAKRFLLHLPRRRSDFLPAPFGARVQIPANKVKSPAQMCGAFSGGEGGI